MSCDVTLAPGDELLPEAALVLSGNGERRDERAVADDRLLDAEARHCVDEGRVGADVIRSSPAIETLLLLGRECEEPVLVPVQRSHII